MRALSGSRVAWRGPSGLLTHALRTNTGPLSGRVGLDGQAWIHLVGVFDTGGHWLLYADGKLIGEQKPHALVVTQ